MPEEWGKTAKEVVVGRTLAMGEPRMRKPRIALHDGRGELGIEDPEAPPARRSAVDRVECPNKSDAPS